MSDIILEAKHTGILTFGDQEIPCVVLSNKKRVLVQREVVYLITGNRKGGLDRYTKAKGVRKFMPQKYVDNMHKDVVLKFMVGNKLAYGYEASDLIDICDAYLKARNAGELDLNTQGHLAAKAEIIIRSCAKVGIEALIDEATGYQAERDADELQIKLKAYIAEGLREWTKTFPDEFFRQLYRLEGINQPFKKRPYPKRFGRHIMRYVYDTLDPDVSDWLRKNNPDPSWNKHHHQWLSAEFGYPKLQRHLSSVMGIQFASITMETFKENLARAYPEARLNRLKRQRKDKKKQDENQMDIFSYL